jgi:hypothetical protein
LVELAGLWLVYQDAALWFNEGYIDQLTPMSYHWTTADGFYGMLTGDGSQSWGYWIQPGISAGRLFSSVPAPIFSMKITFGTVTRQLLTPAVMLVGLMDFSSLVMPAGTTTCIGTLPERPFLRKRPKLELMKPSALHVQVRQP